MPNLCIMTNCSPGSLASINAWNEAQEPFQFSFVAPRGHWVSIDAWDEAQEPFQFSFVAPRGHWASINVWDEAQEPFQFSFVVPRGHWVSINAAQKQRFRTHSLHSKWARLIMVLKRAADISRIKLR